MIDYCWVHFAECGASKPSVFFQYFPASFPPSLSNANIAGMVRYFRSGLLEREILVERRYSS